MADEGSHLFAKEGYDPTFRRQMQRLHHLTVMGRWSFAGLLWLCLAPISLWGLRAEIALLREYFTWAALRYGLIYNPLPTFGLSLCIGTTVAVLIWQSCNILFGLPQPQIKRLERQLIRIREQGPSHPLWKWVCEENQGG
ncbi:hypothetical protein H6G89_05735 [Oscillatoria sp. FACHB-1407]|uniref:hypothetical protein n=1 Tax=Oscillatoria sp. FACHB-1407 TaxID=2692847 RepID=UPI001688A75C|nr:hypothetical protein [Oscillatoria sp. FACHB-1407]MBD2460541.1 hypothetical protein [Oscillatoria sp. FACHB-1407]